MLVFLNQSLYVYKFYRRQKNEILKKNLTTDMLELEWTDTKFWFFKHLWNIVEIT